MWMCEACIEWHILKMGGRNDKDYKIGYKIKSTPFTFFHFTFVLRTNV